MIDQGEEIMRVLGFRQTRVRHHGELARIEIARDELSAALNIETFDRIGVEFKKIGFRFISVDVDGYRTGSLNQSLTQISVPTK
jgi:uncharacterized protein